MNILFTSDLTGMGGGETSLFNICNVLKTDNKIVVICGCNGTLVRLLESIGVKTYVINYRSRRMLIRNIFKIRHIILTEQIKIIHNNDPLTSVLFYFATIGIRRTNFWTCHGQWYDFGFFKRFLVKKCNSHIFCVSTKVEESLKDMGFCRTSVSYLGIPIAKYEQAEPSCLRQELGLNEDDFLLGVVGRFQKIKGQLKLVKAIEVLVKEKNNIICLLIGGCVYNNKDENNYLEEIREYINRHNLQNNILFVGERNDIPNIMHELNLLVIPSDNESFGMVAIEALASGLAVVSTPKDGVSEILDYHKELIAETNDPIGLKKVIESYISSQKIQKFAHLFAEQRKNDYDINIVVRRYLNVFKKLGEA